MSVVQVVVEAQATRPLGAAADSVISIPPTDKQQLWWDASAISEGDRDRGTHEVELIL